jgi:hypothetical protein
LDIVFVRQLIRSSLTSSQSLIIARVRQDSDMAVDGKSFSTRLLQSPAAVAKTGGRGYINDQLTGLNEAAVCKAQDAGRRAEGKGRKAQGKGQNAEGIGSKR